MKLKCKDCGEVFIPKPTDIHHWEYAYVFCPECRGIVLVDTSQVKDDKC